MKNCWANTLGNCSNKRSLEHLISQNLFDSRTIKIQGFDWCKEEKEIGLANAGRKILCTKHNSELSHLDSEAGKFMDALMHATEISQKRKKLKPKKWSIHRATVDGYLIERWFIKTFINISLNDIDKCAIPLNEMVNVVYGNKTLSKNTGLYVSAAVGDDVKIERSFSFKPLWKHKVLVAGIFEFSGYEFVIAFADVRPFFSNRSFNYHNKAFQIKIGRHVSHRLSFKWQA